MAGAFAEGCRAGDVLGLEGTLGAGKTCFVKGLARGLGVPEDQAVTSPTFVLLRHYSGRLTLYHFDAYRLTGADEMEALGCAEVFEAGGVSVVEWADHVAACLPPEHLWVKIFVRGSTEREFRLSAAGPKAAARIEELRRLLADWLC